MTRFLFFVYIHSVTRFRSFLLVKSKVRSHDKKANLLVLVWKRFSSNFRNARNGGNSGGNVADERFHIIMDTPGILASAAFAAVTSALAFRVNQEVPDPYMDEIFHVPQVQRFCKGRFDEVC